jgi:hypothetical protein
MIVQDPYRQIFQSAVPTKMLPFGKYQAAEFGSMGWFYHDPDNCQSANWIPIDDDLLREAVKALWKAYSGE